MSLLLSAWQIVIKRSLANWRLLSTVLVGVIVAVALLSSAPLYSNAINDLGLKHTLENRVIEMIDLQVYAPNYYVNQEEYLEATALIEQQVSKNIRPVIRQDETWVKSQTFYAYYTDRPTPGGQFQPKGHFQVFSNLIDHIDIVEGRYYEATPAGLTEEQLEDPDFSIEGMIGSETAEKFQVGVGDYLVFEGGYGDNQNRLMIELVAIVDPKDPNDEFWFLNTDIFTVPQGSEEPPIAPIFIPKETLFNVYPYLFKDGRATFNWLYFVDIEKINSTNAETIKNAIDDMRILVDSLNIQSEVEIGIKPPRYEAYVMSKDDEIIQIFDPIYRNVMQMAPSYEFSNGITDANIFAGEGGIPCLHLGPEGGGVHEKNEFILLEWLPLISKMYVKIITNFLNG